MDLGALGCLLWTIFAYVVAKRIFIKTGKIYFSPIITVPVSSILLLYFLHISYATYYLYTQYLVNMLGPITVVFAVPIYRYRQTIKENLVTLFFASMVAMIVSVVSGYYLAQLFQFNSVLTNSLLARSISIPFALTLAEQIHGSCSLVLLFTVVTGLVGMIFGDLVLLSLRSKSVLANGAVFGNAAHAMGIARAQQRHHEEGVIASLSMIISGIFMVVCGPSIISIIQTMM